MNRLWVISDSKKKVVGQQKSPFLAKIAFFFQKSTLFKSPITQKRSIFEHSYVSYDKRQKN